MTSPTILAAHPAIRRDNTDRVALRIALSAVRAVHARHSTDDLADLTVLVADHLDRGRVPSSSAPAHALRFARDATAAAHGPDQSRWPRWAAALLAGR